MAPKETISVAVLMWSADAMVIPDATQHDVTNVKHRTTEAHTEDTVILPITQI